MKLTTKIIIGLVSLVVGIFTAIAVRTVVYKANLQTEILQNLLMENTVYLNQKIDDLRSEIINLVNKQAEIAVTKEKFKQRLLEMKLKIITVIINNETEGSLGSGVTIKWNDQYYVLTAGHMADNPESKISISENGQKICDMEIVKQAYTFSDEITSDGMDLLLLKPKDANFVPKVYADIAQFEPQTGEPIIICGNPMGVEDVISIGRVAVYEDNFMTFRDSTYFGNSGGGIYNEAGQLIGIMSFIRQLQGKSNFPPFILESCVRLREILNFLEDVK